MTTLVVRRARPADLDFIVANNMALALETEGRVLDKATVERGVAALFADESKGFYLLAERGGTTVGQLMVTYEWSDWRNGTFFWIQSVYVAASERRTGVYRSLYRRALELARESGDVCGVRLYVERENTAAQATYSALGMTRAHYELYEVDFVLGSS